MKNTDVGLLSSRPRVRLTPGTPMESMGYLLLAGIPFIFSASFILFVSRCHRSKKTRRSLPSLPYLAVRSKCFVPFPSRTRRHVCTTSDDHSKFRSQVVSGTTFFPPTAITVCRNARRPKRTVYEISSSGCAAYMDSCPASQRHRPDHGFFLCFVSAHPLYGVS